jgi:hypothetical protein
MPVSLIRRIDFNQPVAREASCPPCQGAPTDVAPGWSYGKLDAGRGIVGTARTCSRMFVGV